ncbi:N-acylneuraminate cytidylyltransferase A isoform X2 [Macrobrachium rosenbergii]
MTTVGLVLARGGSKGIVNKNLARLEGKPLLLRTLEVMHQAKCFDSIWVSTDDDKIAEYAEKGQANVHRRASYTATDEATSLIAVQEFLQYHPEFTHVCLVQCTSPFIKAKYLREGVKKILGEYDSVFSVTRRHNLRWTEGNNTKPQNFDPSHRPRRQDWGGDLCENGMFYFTRVSLINQGLLQGGRCGYVEIPTEDSLEIDTPLDIIIAQEWLDYHKKQCYNKVK